MRATRSCFLLLVVVVLLAPAATLQSTIFQVTGDQFRIKYDVTSLDFLHDHELEIQFEPDTYAGLANAAGPAGFDIMLFQPGDPLGTVGRFSALATVDHPLLDGGFSVDVRMRTQQAPGSQRFAINQLEGRGVIVSVLQQGVTSAVPEPSTSQLFMLAMLAACGWRLRRWTRNIG